MKTWDFTVILQGVEDMTDVLSDALYEAGCDDATAGNSAGVASASFSREAPSLHAAISSAVRDIRKAGCEASRVEIEELTETELVEWQKV